MNAVVTISPDLTLDCSGLSCPMPVIKTSRAIKGLEIGQILKVISTDPGSPPDLRAWSNLTGRELLDSRRENDKFIFLFRKTK